MRDRTDIPHFAQPPFAGRVPRPDAFNLAQLTKEMVVGHLSNLADPAHVAAETVRGTLTARLKGRGLRRHEVHAAVVEVCRGAVQAMVIMECPLGRGAAKLLTACQSFAETEGLDPAMIGLAAVEGISDLHRFVPPNHLPAIRACLEAACSGAGGTFEGFCLGQAPHQSHPGYVPPID